MSEITIIIASCKNYNDVTDVLLDKLYENEILAFSDKIIIATDDESHAVRSDLKECVTLAVGEEWGERVLNAIQMVDTEYCLLIFDDYIPNSKIEFGSISHMARELVDIDCVYLASVFGDLTYLGPMFEGFALLPKNKLYRVNSTAALWKKSSLKLVLSDTDSPWEWESFAGFRKSVKNMRFLAPLNKENELYRYNYKTGGCVYRGGWVYESLKEVGFSDNEIERDFTARPVIKALSSSKRSLSWKWNFFANGFRMVQFKILIFILLSLREKYKF